MKANLIFVILLTALCGAAHAKDIVNIGSRRELFLDNLMVDRLEGGAQRVFHKPVPREVVITFDKPWEGNTCLAVAVFQVGDVYRLYYRASNTPGSAGGEKRGAHAFDAYAESRDGRHWTRPALGLVEFQGSKDNNLIPKPAAPEGWALDALTPFRDENHEAAADALYKAVAPLYGPGNTADDWLSREKSLAVLTSPDGIRWTLMQDQGVFAKEGFFDSVNLAFWDPNTGAYRAYFRDARQPGFLRDIKTGTSPDFRHWTRGTWLSYASKPSAQFYTNGVRPYHRAPHMYLGFPGMYAQEFYYIGDVRLRRYTLRLDGFASIHAPIAGGELVTPPLIFKGKSLSMNFASSAFGSLRVEIQDADGKPLPGITLDDSIELYGDTVARNAIWKNNPDLGVLAGKPVRLRFVMRDADLYSIKFEETK